MYESVSRSDNAPLALVQQVVEVLGGGRAGLVTDVDGTISPIVALPDQAQVLPRAKTALVGLSQVLALVSVVSGRTVADARSMVGIDGLTYIGNHGLEIWSERGPHIVPEARPWVPRLAAVLDDIGRELHEPGILIENKGATASLHYRLAPDPEQARQELLGVMARCALTAGLRVEEGRMVFNLLPPLEVTKGTAITWLIREHQLQRLVYFGDDVTDAHAFEAVAGLRHSGEVSALSIGVQGPETPPGVFELADATVASVEAVADLLCDVLDHLRSSARMDSGAPSVGSETHGEGHADVRTRQ